MAFSSLYDVLNAMARAELVEPGAANPARYALRYREAAIQLHELLSINGNRPIWWEVHPKTKRPLPNDGLHVAGLDLLLQVVDFQSWRMAMEEEHHQLCVKSGKPLEDVPMQPSQPAPEGAYSTRQFQVGFDRQAAIDFLSRHGVKHGLGTNSEDAAFEPLAQVKLIAARLANERWDFTKEADATSEVHRLGITDQYPGGMPAWLAMQLHAGRENESAINAGLDAGRLPVYQKTAMGVYAPSTRREGAYLKLSDVLDFIRVGGLHAIEEADATPEEAPKSASKLDAPKGQQSREKPETVAFRNEVHRLMGVFWNQRAHGSSPTKAELHEQVHREMLKGSIRGRGGKLNVSMVKDASKSWKRPLEVPSNFDSYTPAGGRHPWKEGR